ncbi:copper chaperone PCu(A)C [Aestuariivirga sp.]|uniref:copper chaperone PCu(A)C n=1 Tax=Aestuariivirga sp. TaxID=2650926 RepID=UPI00391A285B
MKLFKEIAFATALTLASVFAATAGEAHEVKAGDLVIGHPWSRQSPMAANVAAGFLVITNTGMEDDRLVKATAEISPTVQLHDMKMEGDVMKMVEIPEGIPIPAGATVELKPRSLHIMFMDLAAPPQQGQLFKGTLTFEKAGTVEVEFEVLAPGAVMN